MEKISSIIPSSARVQSVDLGSSHPIRPGQPSFGRPVGTSTLAGETRAETIAADAAEQKKMRDQEKMVQTLTDAFFMNQVKKSEVASAPVADPLTVAPQAVAASEPKETNEADLDQAAYGRYIDVHV